MVVGRSHSPAPCPEPLPPTFSTAASSLAHALTTMCRALGAAAPADSPPPATADTPHTPAAPPAPRLTERVPDRLLQQWRPAKPQWVKREHRDARRYHAYVKQQQEKAAAAAALALAGGGHARRSVRQAERPLAKKPWRALMKGAREDSDNDGGEKEDDDAASSAPSTDVAVRHRTVGEIKVQVFSKVLSKAAINVLMKGEPQGSTTSRNPWPGVSTFIRAFFETTFATQVKHPYIAEINSRCDSMGPPQRLDLLLTPSGVKHLLPPATIQAVDAVVYGLKTALRFTTGNVKWDSHLVLVLPGAPEQKFHCDSSRSWFYFTLIFPLSKDPPKAGRTEFWDKADQPKVPVGPGDILVFDGKRKHRGSANTTKNHVRVFLYIVVYTGTDWN